HGRVQGGDRGTAAAGAQAAWLADHQAGWDTLLLAVSRSQVAEMAGWCRAQLVDAGDVDDDHTVVLRDENRAGAGDLVATRCNDRALGVANRDVWSVEYVSPGGDIAVRHVSR